MCDAGWPIAITYCVGGFENIARSTNRSHYLIHGDSCRFNVSQCNTNQNHQLWLIHVGGISSFCTEYSLGVLLRCNSGRAKKIVTQPADVEMYNI